MPDAQHAPERLRRYLEDLKPEARASLLADLEAGALRPDQLPEAKLILAELRRMRTAPREQPSPDRLFFSPLSPFVIDDDPARKHPGRIARRSLERVWQWIARDLAPQQTSTFADAVSVLAGKPADVEAAARRFQDLVKRGIYEALAGARHDHKAERQLAGRIGTPRAVEEAREIAAILEVRDPLSTLAKRLPPSIGNLSDHQLDNMKALLDQASVRALFLHAVLLVMSRLAAPWQLIRLATKAAGTDESDRVAETPYAVTITAVLAEMEAMVWRLEATLKAGDVQTIARLLKDIHDTARGLRTEINLAVDGAWARQLAALRGEVSKRLAAQIESTPGKVRRLLRPPRQIGRDTVLDPTDTAEIEAAIELVGICRTYAGELAINEATLRVSSDLEGVLERETSTLLAALRQAGDGERRYRQSQLDAAVRFAAQIFGTEYASLLAKAAEVALSDRKTVRA
ncbi:MAG TPA: hypothetical protein VEK55_05430 [Xanthobacteraceae bacterium]|nr:hypothetical protein [Xanthobacteraceae bacterium]